MKENVPSNPSPGLPQTGTDILKHAEARRQELVALKRKLAGQGHPDVHPRQPPQRTLLDQRKDEEVRTFIRTLTERKEKRKYQLSIVKSFLEDPLRFGLQTDLVPSSTTSEEIEQRKQELDYRIKLLKTLLEIMEGEMVLLEQGEAYVTAQTEQADTKAE